MEKVLYKSMYLHEQDFWWHLGMRRITETLLGGFVPLENKVENKILDVGCGAGGKFEMLAQYGKVYGIDVSGEALRYAKLGHVAEVSYGSVEQIPMESNEFDMLNCNDVLYHSSVGDDVVAIGEFARVLKPGGILFIREPAFNWLQGHNDRLGWTKRRYTKKELTGKLEKNNFEILRASYANCFLFPVVLVVRVVERILGREEVPAEVYRPPVINSLLKYVLFLEAGLLHITNLPFGVSTVCIARKKM